MLDIKLFWRLMLTVMKGFFLASIFWGRSRLCSIYSIG